MSEWKIGHKIKYLRTHNEMTQTELAAKLGVSKSIISAYEKCIRNPSYETIVKLADIFHVSLGELFKSDEFDNTTKKIDISKLTIHQQKMVEDLIRGFIKENYKDKED